MTATSTLLIRLDGPVQAWGEPGAAWDNRPTSTRPTKSAIIGLAAAALGRPRGADLGDLAALRYSGRADRPGHIEFDYRTAGGGTFPLDALTANANPRHASGHALGERLVYGAPQGADPSWAPKARTGVDRSQTYLADAALLAALTGPTSLLEDIQDALAHPHWPLTLGRRACPPARDLPYRLLRGDQHDTWADTEPLLDRATTAHPDTWRETTSGGTVSYEQPAGGRRFAPLLVTTGTASPPAHQEAAKQ